MKINYYNGTILTMDETHPTATSVTIEDDMIVSLDETIEADVSVDLKGHVMMPGFIDGHSHFVGLANSLSQCDLTDARSFEEIQLRLKGFIEKNKLPKGSFIVGSHYDHNDLVEGRHPDKYVLDEISTAYCIVIVHASGHMGVGNSLALETMHIAKDAKDIEGGKYGRVAGTNEINGYMEENVFIEFQNKMPMIPVERLMQLMVEAQHIYASYGITTIQDGMVSAPLYQLLQYAANEGLLTLDVVAYVDAKIRNQIAADKQYHHHLKIAGYKTFLDGSPQGRTAWMETPYQGEDTYCGYPILKDEQLYQEIYDVLSKDCQLLAHCNGDGAAEQYITQFEKVKKDHPKLDTCRSVMIHAQLVRKDQLERMAKVGLMPSFFIAHTYYWGDVHIKNFGKARANKISPAKDAVDLKLPFTFHQDSPVLMPDMMKTVWCACNRKTKAGVAIDDNEIIDVEDALKAITVYGAYQYFEEASKGSITVGKKADLVILSKNPMEVNPADLDQIEVLETIKDGKSIYRKSVDSK